MIQVQTHYLSKFYKKETKSYPEKKLGIDIVDISITITTLTKACISLQNALTRRTILDSTLNGLIK